jgi:hypothetical protein
MSLLARTAAALALAGLALPAAAPARTVPFSGSCRIGGPISPQPPITAFPRLGARFSFSGTGTCGPAPASLTFTNVTTLFDTCELGPDFGLRGTLRIGAARFAITVNLARLALAGPLLVTTARGGVAVGLAQFAPTGDPATALRSCAGAGIAAATLTARFRTLRPLSGTSP